MEDGSLLPNALRSMQKLRENEQNLNFPFHHFFEPQQKDENNRPLDSNLHLGTRNALVISLYCIDSGSDVNLGLDADAPLHRKQLLRSESWLRSITSFTQKSFLFITNDTSTIGSQGEKAYVSGFIVRMCIAPTITIKAVQVRSRYGYRT